MNFVIIRGGGDLASGVVLRLHRADIRVLVTEIEKPLAVRRTVAFAEAIYAGHVQIEDVIGRRINKLEDAAALFEAGQIPVLVDPALGHFKDPVHRVLVDARMTKRAPDVIANAAAFVVGLGPGFIAGENCHAVVETMRGHNLGRVLWHGGALADTGIPASIAQHGQDRILRSQTAGRVSPTVEIGQQLKSGDLIARVDGAELRAPFDGVLRGLIHPSVKVDPGMKVGDLDPRNDPSYCWRVSDKALAVGGGVLEALMTKPEIRSTLWQ